MMAPTSLRRRQHPSSQCGLDAGVEIAAWAEVTEGNAAVNLARNATFAAMIATMWAIWAAAKPIAATGEANLRSVLGIDSKSLTLIPKGSLVEVRDYSDGWCHVAW